MQLPHVAVLGVSNRISIHFTTGDPIQRLKWRVSIKHTLRATLGVPTALCRRNQKGLIYSVETLLVFCFMIYKSYPFTLSAFLHGKLMNSDEHTRLQGGPL